VGTRTPSFGVVGDSPLPDYSTEPRARGHRLARATAQLMWQRAADERKISQLTPPGDVLDSDGPNGY
jgi:hypothetical protein